MKIVKKEKVFKGFFDLEEYIIVTNDGEEIKRLVLERGNAVAAIVYDTSKKVFYLAKQWRSGSASEMVEIVAGIVESNDLEEDMKREIDEELGYLVNNIEQIAQCYMSPGGSTEMITIYYAEVSEKIGDGGGLVEEQEEIVITPFSLDELLSFPFNDAKTIIAVDFVRQNIGKF